MVGYRHLSERVVKEVRSFYGKLLWYLYVDGVYYYWYYSVYGDGEEVTLFLTSPQWKLYPHLQDTTSTVQ